MFNSPTIIVADSSPLIGLSKIGKLELLHSFAERVLIPTEVWRETTFLDKAGAGNIRRAQWIEIVLLDSQTRSSVTFEFNLGAGEAEAILLARTVAGSRLLIDDRNGRIEAQRLNVPFIGTVGMLMAAKQAGLIQVLRPLLDGLRENGMFIGDEFYDKALKSVGEV